MSRLPGGLFVGVVTLVCGLGFAQMERSGQDDYSATNLRTAPSPTESKEQQETSPESGETPSVVTPPQIAADERAKS